MSTIVAISTAPGIGGIGIIRMSGKDCFKVLDKIFKPINKSVEKGYTIKYGKILDGEETIDEVLVSYFLEPRSYTTENMCEINSHGGNIIMRKILDLCLKNGAELAEPGEFTKRAFLNGRIDLTQAEAVIDVINSRSDKEAEASINQLEGNLSKKIKEIREDLISGLADIEVSIDYPEYDEVEITNKKIIDILEKNEKKLIKLEKSFINGKILREGVKTAIIGRPNAGKSSLLNLFLNEERAIVTDIEGTTRDTIEEYMTIGGVPFKIIDTAGIRRKSKVDERIEKFSVARTMLAIERSDVCLMMIDANEGVTDQDAKIAGEAHEAGKGVIIVVNKWDEYEKETGTLEKYKKEVYAKLSYLSYAPIIFISAKTGQRVNKLFELINMVANNNALRVSTSVLNQVLNEAIALVQPPTDKGRRLKVLYITQASTKPPTFVIFVNSKKIFHFSYQRYIVNQIRKEFGLEGTPVRIIVREKEEK